MIVASRGMSDEPFFVLSVFYILVMLFVTLKDTSISIINTLKSRKFKGTSGNIFPKNWGLTDENPINKT